MPASLCPNQPLHSMSQIPLSCFRLTTLLICLWSLMHCREELLDYRPVLFRHSNCIAIIVIYNGVFFILSHARSILPFCCDWKRLLCPEIGGSYKDESKTN